MCRCRTSSHAAARRRRPSRMPPRYPRPLTKEIDMSRKIALVTGGNRGIGLETSRQLAAQGVHLIGAARELSKATETVAELTGSGGRSEEHTSELTSLMRISYDVICLKKKTI